MTILRVHDYVTNPAPLRRHARAVRPDEFATDAFQQFAHDLKETMRAYRGLGLAATQVDACAPDGTVWRVFAMRHERLPLVEVFCNPKILKATKPVWANEGCLSFRSVAVRVRSPSYLELEATNDEGKVDAWSVDGIGARVCAHEIEHLEGKTMVDRMSYIEKARFTQRVKRAPRVIAVNAVGESIEAAG